MAASLPPPGLPGMTVLPPVNNRTRVANGSSALPGVDGRTLAARRYREITLQLANDLGGDPSEGQTQIIRRAAMLAIWLENADAKATAGTDDIDIASYTTAANTLSRLVKMLGLERRARDVTPALSDYIRRSA